MAERMFLECFQPWNLQHGGAYHGGAPANRSCRRVAIIGTFFGSFLFFCFGKIRVQARLFYQSQMQNKLQYQFPPHMVLHCYIFVRAQQITLQISLAESPNVLSVNALQSSFSYVHQQICTTIKPHTATRARLDELVRY